MAIGEVTPVYFEGRLVGWDQVDEFDPREVRIWAAAKYGKDGAVPALLREWHVLDRQERARLAMSLATPTWKQP